MAPAMRKWKCPRCGSGALAPSKPRRDDVRRYCLVCSASTGRLVMREAPALEAERARRAETTKAKREATKQRAARATAERFTVAEIDLRDEMHHFVHHAEVFIPLRGQKIDLRVRRCSRKPRTRFGFAWWHKMQIRILAYPAIDVHDVRETLVHELVHLVVREGGSDGAHGVKFRATLRLACEQLFWIRPTLNRIAHGEIAGLLRAHAPRAANAEVG